MGDNKRFCLEKIFVLLWGGGNGGDNVNPLSIDMVPTLKRLYVKNVHMKLNCPSKAKVKLIPTYVLKSFKVNRCSSSFLNVF
jgi:hypothetical protein